MRGRIRASLLLSAVLVGLASSARGQETPETTAPAQPNGQALTPDRLEALRKEAAESSELDEETKKKVAEIYRAAAGELQRASELAALAATFKTSAEAVQSRVGQTKQQLEELKAKASALPEAATLAELEQAHSKLELQLTALKKTQSAAEAEPKVRAERRKEIRSRLPAVSEKLAELTKQANSLPGDEHPLVTAARKAELGARRLALENEIPALENELTKFDVEDAADLVRLGRDLTTQQVAFVERNLQLLADQLKRERATAAAEAVRKARTEAIAADPVLKSHAERNRLLAEAARAVTERFNLADADLKTAKDVLHQLDRQFEQTRKKVESVGLTSSVGALLRKQRATLPDVHRRRVAVKSREKTIDETQYELFEYDEERQELADPEALVLQILASANPRDREDRDLLEAAVRELLDRKREYLDALIRNYNKYFDTLVELDTTEQQIISGVQHYQQYIDERVLWTRSGNVLTSELPFDQSDAWFFSGDRWTEIPIRLWDDVLKHPALYGVAFLCLAVLAVQQKRFRGELFEIGVFVQRPACYQILPTLRAVLLTFAVATLFPGLLLFAAWRLDLAASGSPFVKAVASGLFCLFAMWLPLELFRQVCRPNGLAEAHFAWPPSATQLLRKNLRWLIFLGLPLTFITSTLFAGDPTHGRDTVERICFILQAIVLAVFLRRVLRPSGGVFREYIAYHQNGWIDRLKFVWYWVGVAMPMLLAGLAFWGYYYTAQVLSWRLHATMCFVSAFVLLRALLLRLILLRRRKLSIEQARGRAAAAAQSGEQSGTPPPAGIVTDCPQANLSAHSIQTQRLLTTGMLAATLVGFWLIWVEVLPALRMLDQWPLWTTTTSVQVVEQSPLPASGPMSELASAETPASTTRTEYHETSITFSDAALAVLIAVITCIAARNVPGLLEMSVLQRLPLDASVRYAITSLVSYGIVLLGVIVASSNIGLRWSQIQWLATALTFGLAFGLQEIFANFVAGLIILFERPVRVGDIVTVDEVTGVVSRIRIRATSITNWDRKEYVVPNKEFITGRVLNWTLSDHINRIVINVGVAYGSDTRRVRELLLEAAENHDLILKDPPAVATFEGFGDNSLNFTLRTFLPNMDNRLQVIHDLHTAIDEAFRDAKIEIAFPQRDLHIRSTPDAWALSALQPRSQKSRQQEAA